MSAIDHYQKSPSKKKLLEMGLDDVVEELWPPEELPQFGPPRPSS
jgi:hypothetical protein